MTLYRFGEDAYEVDEERELVRTILFAGQTNQVRSKWKPYEKLETWEIGDKLFLTVHKSSNFLRTVEVRGVEPALPFTV